MSKLVQIGLDRREAEEAIVALGLDIHALALAAGAMFPVTKAHGLSHGDRACLALGARLGVPILTADKAWSKVAPELGVTVDQFR